MHSIVELSSVQRSHNHRTLSTPARNPWGTNVQFVGQRHISIWGVAGDTDVSNYHSNSSARLSSPIESRSSTPAPRVVAVAITERQTEIYASRTLEPSKQGELPSYGEATGTEEVQLERQVKTGLGIIGIVNKFFALVRESGAAP